MTTSARKAPIGGARLVAAGILLSRVFGLVRQRATAHFLGSGPADLTGNALDNLLEAGAGDNAIDGGGGRDTVSYSMAAAGVTVSLLNVALSLPASRELARVTVSLPPSPSLPASP